VASFDPQEMVARFRERAEAVRTRGMPPIEGAERQRFREQAQRDYTDFAIIGDAEAELVDGILTLRIDLRPAEARADTDSG
jgi:flagellar motor component MotA